MLVGDADRVQQLEHPRRGVHRGPLLHHDERVLDVFKGGQHREEIEALKDKPDMVPAKRGGLPPVEARHIHAGDLQAAAAWAYPDSR